MKKWFPSLTLLFLLSAPSLLFADSLSLTTYYPAPFGSYSLLKLTPTADASMGACDTTKNGLIYLSSDSNQLKICIDGSWDTTSPWTLNAAGKIVYLTNSDTDTAYKTGIGVLSPNARFHVNGIDDATYGQMELESSGSDAKLSLFNSSGATTTGNSSIAMSNTAGSEGLRFLINNVDKMILDENGNIGVGLTAPNTNLHVTGSDNNIYGQLAVQSSGIDARLSLTNSNGLSETGHGDIMMSRTPASEGLRFLINGVDKMIVDEFGNVGIGVVAPDARLDIEHPSGNGIHTLAKMDEFYFMHEDSAGYSSFSFCYQSANCQIADTNFMGIRFYSTPATTYNMTLGVPFSVGNNSSVTMQVGSVAQLVANPTAVVTDDSVNVGIGIATPTYKLHVNGPIGGKLDSANPATVGELQVNCSTVPGKCYATYAP
jgi:hypothetical protein